MVLINMIPKNSVIVHADWRTYLGKEDHDWFDPS